MTSKIIHGDAIEEMKKMEANSVDTIITDPPYLIGFMSKSWDKQDSSFHYNWAKEALRVAKPGATLLCFGGTRTYHRLACAIEDAGWILKDCIMWLYGSGFPKATDISKQLDKRGKGRYLEFTEMIKKYREKKGLSMTEVAELGKFYGEINHGGAIVNWEKGYNIPTIKQYNKLIEILEIPIEKADEVKREIIGKDKNWGKKGSVPISGYKEFDITEPATEEAKLWNGWKSHGLKPAYEPIIVAMKPNEGTYAENAIRWGVSGLNIDGGRIETDRKKEPREFDKEKCSGKTGSNKGVFKMGNNQPRSDKWLSQGRFPANLILDKKAAKQLGESSRFFKVI